MAFISKDCQEHFLTIECIFNGINVLSCSDEEIAPKLWHSHTFFISHYSIVVKDCRQKAINNFFNSTVTLSNAVQHSTEYKKGNEINIKYFPYSFISFSEDLPQDIQEKILKIWILC